ncbi:ovochymase-1 [Paroedura picta]|uniref:ovochymase-1 n=1 Tax=Paroedura picta TaxID=143630 RepID=UPI0040569A1F
MGESIGISSMLAMRRLLWCGLLAFFSQCGLLCFTASWGSEIAEPNRTELSQQRRQVPQDLDPSQSLDSEVLHSGLKCGVRFLELEGEEGFPEAGFFSRIIGGRDSAPGKQPWQVSLKLGLSHFCGGSLIREDLVVTAAHCVANLDLELVKNLIVTVGEYDLRRVDQGEQHIPVSKISIHPAFGRFGDVHSDIALLHLKYRIKYGHDVQPICLPHKGETFEEGMLCVVSGWGKVSEDGALSNILQEVALPILGSRFCSELLEALDLPPMGSSLLCAGFPDGRKDACQGDSGGPLACRRSSGLWTLAGITSWGVGCGRGWLADERSPAGGRGSPGIFANVAELWDFVAQNMVTVPEPSYLLHPSPEDCSSQGTLISGENGRVRHPRLMEDHYLDNSLCIWNITVLEDKFILIRFTKIDIEDQVECDHDYVTLHSSEEKLIGKVCGDVLPSPLLIDSNRAMVTFVADGSQTGGGFEFLYTAVHKASEAGSGCGSVAVLVEEGKFDTANYPGLYPSQTKCHWLLEAPMDHVIKLEFEDFAVEVSKDCIYDAVVVFDDTEEEHQLALLCGFSIPSPIWSSGNILLIRFWSDGENNFRGFKARFTFSPTENSKADFSGPLFVQASLPKHVPVDVCGSPPFGPQWLSRGVVGGVESCPHCWPWHVGLRFLGDYVCGGVIIGPEWVLTAAHCLQLTNKSTYWTVVAGDHDRLLKEPAEQIRRVKTILIHWDFDVTSYDSDIALVQLGAPLSYNAAVRPICLPNHTEPLFDSLLCTVTGWGSIQEAGGLASRLQQSQVPILNNDVCERNYYSNHPGGISVRMLCAGFASSRGQDPCQGDSGGPLVCPNEDASFTLYGVASWGVGCARPRKPGVYTRVRVFLDWILSRMNEKGPAAVPVNHPGQETVEGPPVLFMNLSGAPYGQGPKMGKNLKYPNLLNQQLAHCRDAILTAQEGIIQSPGFPNGYPKTASCCWRIVGPLNSVIRLDFLDFTFEKALSDCRGGLSIYEGLESVKEVLGNFCDGAPRFPLKSHGPVVTLTFNSGAATMMKGFVLAYGIHGIQPSPVLNRTRDAVKECPILDLIPVGMAELTSPNYPHIYPSLLTCTWTVYSASGNRLKAVIKDLGTEDAEDCAWDSLNICDGPDCHSEVLGRLCGQKRDLQFVSSGSYLTVRFKTDVSIGDRGFKMVFEELNQGPAQRSKNGIELKHQCN